MSRPTVHPSLRLVAGTLPSVAYTERTLPVGRFIMRRVLATRPVAGVTAEDARLDGARVRLYTPSRRRGRGAILWIHGGGLVSGHPVQADIRCSRLAY